MSLDDKIQITCSGEDSSNHPKVFITFKRNQDEIKCTYCGKLFKKSDYQHHKYDSNLCNNMELKNSTINEKKSV